ncbi:MAG: MFS transporter [Chloroflexi bacterium]|nr:MFS transporter [Chloroflexota bacterium]
MTDNEKRVVVYTSAAHALNHALELTYGAVLLVVAAQFGVGLGTLGILASIAALAYALSALPAGTVVDRLGSKRVIVLSLVGAAAGSVVAAMSQSVWVLAAGLTVVGFFGGMYHPAGLTFIARGVRGRARGLGLHGMGGNLGVALAPVVAATIAGVYTWRASFLLFGAIALLAAVVMQVSKVTEGEYARASGQREAHARGSNREVTRAVLFPLVLIFVINALFGFIYRGTTTFLPAHLTENLRFDLFGLAPVTIGGSFATVALLFGMAGQYVGGELGERMRRESLLIPLAALAVPALLIVGYTSGAVLVIGAAAFAFVNFMAQPSYNALIADYAPPRMHGRMFGVAFLVGFGFGSFAGTVGGLIAQEVGTAWVFRVLAIFGVLITGCTVAMHLYATRRRG